MATPIILALIAAAGAALAAYITAARQFSGKIETSDAAELWKESRDIRQWAQDRIDELNGTVGTLEQRVRELENQNGDLADKNRELTRELAECRTGLER